MKNTEGLPCGRGLAAPESLSVVVSFSYTDLGCVGKHSNFCFLNKPTATFRLVLLRKAPFKKTKENLDH